MLSLFLNVSKNVINVNSKHKKCIVLRIEQLAISHKKSIHIYLILKFSQTFQMVLAKLNGFKALYHTSKIVLHW